MGDRAAPRLPVLLKAGWSIGAVGAVTMLTLLNVMLIYFMVNYLAIDPVVAGGVVFATRFYDMVFDPCMGWVSDRVATRWGRRRPWMLAAAVISGVTVIAVFHPPQLDPATTLPAYMGLMLALYFSGYTMFYIPFMAMPAEMTDDPDERTSIMSYRTFSSGAGGMVSTSLAPALIPILGGGRHAYDTMSLIVAAIVCGTMLIAVFTTGRARFTEASRVRVAPRIWIASVVSNRPMMALIATKLFVYFAISIGAGINLFFMTSALHRGETGQAMFGLLFNGTTLVALPAWTRFITGKPKQRMLAIAIVIWALATFSWIVAGPDESDAVFVLRSIAVGVGYGGIVLMVLSMLPDVIAYDFQRTGLRREGVFSALFAFVEKTAYAMTPLMVGVVLKFTGYVQGQSGAAVQPDHAIWGVRLGASVLPATVALIGLVFLRSYALDPARLHGPTHDRGTPT